MTPRQILTVAILGAVACQLPGQRVHQDSGRGLWDVAQQDTLTGTWGGARPWLSDQGIDVGGGWIADWSGVWRGGLRNRDTFRHFTHVDVGFDLEQLLGLPTTAVFFEGQVLQGRDVTGDIGDFQVASNIDGPNREQISEAWIESRFGTDWLRGKFGKVDANSEFAWLQEGTVFIHSTPGFPPTIVGFASYPDPGVAALLEATLDLGNGWTTAAKLGVFDGALAEGRPIGKLGFGTFFRDDEADSYQTLLELDLRYPSWGALGRGRLALGGWHHSARFERFGGGSQRGTEGLYALWDQRLWSESDVTDDAWQGLAMAANLGMADQQVSEAASTWFLGFTYTGVLPGRDRDVLAVGVSHVDMSDAPGAGFAQNETAWELQYRMQLTPWLQLAPAVQYVDRPFGDPAIEPAWIGTLRCEVTF